MTRVMWPTLARAFRRTALPLGSYYLVTLGLPLANGAAHSGAPFFNHALVVIVVPPILIALVCMLHLTARWLIRVFSLGLPRLLE